MIDTSSVYFSNLLAQPFCPLLLQSAHQFHETVLDPLGEPWLEHLPLRAVLVHDHPPLPQNEWIESASLRSILVDGTATIPKKKETSMIDILQNVLPTPFSIEVSMAQVQYPLHIPVRQRHLRITATDITLVDGADIPDLLLPLLGGDDVLQRLL